MARLKLIEANKKIEETVVGAYKKIENGVVGAYKSIEDGAVGAYKSIEDKFVDNFLTKDGETVEEAKKRLAADAERQDNERSGSKGTKSFQDAVRDRLINGFKNWNSGYDGWLEWCNTLYEPDAHYNVGTNRWSLQEYKDAMGELFKHFTMELGKFDNMLVQDDWCAIRYSVKIKNLHTGEEILQHTMEFVHFKENPEPIGARVIEGWALSDLPIHNS